MEEKLINISQLEHVKNESVTMWAGSHQLGINSAYVHNVEKNSFEIQQVQYAASWLKIFDEAIVNAMDHWHRYPKQVTLIDITFNKNTGEIYIKNNGPSVGIKKTKTREGIDIWLPEMAFSVFYSSSNYNTEKRYVGGINGLGTKILGALSTMFEIETVDIKQKKKYVQCFEDRLEKINKPIITDIKNEKEDYTAIRFLPAYSVMGYTNGYKKEYGNDLFKLIETRAYHAKVYTGIIVKLNDKEIIFSKGDSFAEFARMHLKEHLETETDTDEPNNATEYEPNLLSTKLIHSDGEPSLDICIGISDGKFQQISIINGVNVYDGGNLVTYVQNQIVENLKSNVEKILKSTKIKFNKNVIVNSIFLFIKGKLANPNFDSQIKNKIMNPLEYFSKYQFKQSEWKKIWELVRPKIEEMFLNKTQSKEKKRVVRGEVNVPKCCDAQLAGSVKYSKDCILWITEGDSASGTVKSGIVHKCSQLNFKFCGTFNSGGVIMNCRTKCVEKSIKGNTYIVKNSQFENNERLVSLRKVLNLDYAKKYNAETAEGCLEIASLRYGCVIVAVDQDVDGHGIYGLILNFFEYFWPNLVKQGFVKKFNTPIIRAFSIKSGKLNLKEVLEFYSMPQFKEWVNKEFDGNESRASTRYEINYYKGLGSHENTDIPRMFEDYEKQLLTASLDDKAHSNLDIFYGKDTNVRKEILKTPPDELDFKINPVPVSYILNTVVKEYHRDKIFRSLPHAIDGLTQSRRKVLWTARAKFGTTDASNKKMKVALLASETTKFTAYMHGENCISDTIVLMAQMFPGSNHLPMLTPRGYFGGRSKGGKDSASPRYIYTQLNQELCYAMFPAEDDFILDFVFDEGQRCEPKCLVPILPMAILENLSGNIGVGWSSQIWARDIQSVIKNVRAMLNGTQETCYPMKTWLKDNKGKITFYNGKEYSIGKYTYDEKNETIHVSELPLGMYPNSYLEWDSPRPSKTDDKEKKKKMPLWAHEYFSQKPLCETDKDINITFYLKNSSMEEIKKKYGSEFLDPIENFLGLKNSLNTNLNAINWNDTVIEFKKYEEIVNNWFSIRKQLYKKRIDREIIILKLTIRYLENIIRFMDNESKYKFTSKTELDEMKKKLESEKYDKINETVLKSPKYCPVSSLEEIILNNSASTHTYLLSLSNIDKSASNSQKRKDQLQAKKIKLNELEKLYANDQFPGSSLWAAELDHLEKILKNGFDTNWNSMEWEDDGLKKNLTKEKKNIKPRTSKKK